MAANEFELIFFGVLLGATGAMCGFVGAVVVLEFPLGALSRWLFRRLVRAHAQRQPPAHPAQPKG